MTYNKEAALARQGLQNRLNKTIAQLTEITNRIQEATEAVKSRLKQKKGKEFDELRKATLSIQDSLKTAREGIVGKRSDRQGFGRVYMVTPVLKIQEASSYISRRTDPPTKTETLLVDQAELLSNETITKVNAFFSKQWARLLQKSAEFIKEYPPIAGTPE